MNFLSIGFLAFLVVVVLLYRFLKTKKSRHILLLIASYVFYALGDWRFLGLLIGVSALMWFLGRKIGETGKKKYLVVGIVIDVLVLMAFKYYNFFVGSFAQLLGMQYSSLKIILPIGISFYIFQSISYIADIYTKKIQSQGLMNTLLYIGFFPQIVSGPIVKAHDFFPQLEEPREVTAESLSWGAQRFLLGVFKKMVIADRLGVCVDAVYSAPGEYSGISLFFAVLAYSLQIYYDFSGYSDMAIGVAHIFGFDLGKNFNLPYLAKNPSDFWKRWHISLSSWFRDYVYIPLGGNRKGRVRTYLNLFITMLLSGLWHGASWAFVVWGLCHALTSTIHKCFLDIRGKKQSQNKIVGFVCVIINFIVVSLLWILFRTNDFGKTATILTRIFTFASGISYVYIYTLIFTALLIVVEIIAAVKNKGNDIWRPLDLSKFRSKLILCFFALIIVLFAYIGNSAFIYAQF